MGGSSVHSDVHFYCKICKLIPTKGWVGLKTGEKMLTSYVNIPEDIYKGSKLYSLFDELKDQSL